MSLSQKIKEVLQSNYGILFDVKSSMNMSLEEYVIIPKDSNENYFVVDLIIKDDSRLTITCEPDKYGMYFISAINKSDSEQRGIFIKYWNEIINKNLKISVKINDCSVNQKDFVVNNETWQKFQIRVTSPYYYDPESQSKTDVVCDYTNIVIGMILSLLKIEYTGYEEGKEEIVKHKRYERNPINRELCLSIKGYKCSVCGFDFEKTYGSIGKHFIEVHHIKPVSTIGEGYIIDPIKDLVPLCSNCHSMAHKKNPPYTVAELVKILEMNKHEN